jgi:hypothetical protein
MILIGRGMAQFHYPRGNPFMLLRILSMDAGKLQQIQTHARAIAALLYDETAPEQLTTLEGIETAVRGHILEHVSPEIGHFLSQQQAGQRVDELGTSKASLGRSASVKSKRKPFKSKLEPN